MMKVLCEKVETVTRQEANFDRACDELYRKAISYFGIDQDGHSTELHDWERSSSWIETEFTKYTQVQNSHIYNFIIRACKEEEEEEEEEG